MDLVILAAGRGSRLGPVGSIASKAALPLLGKPLITRVHDSIAELVDTTIVVVNPADEHLSELLTSPYWSKTGPEIVVQETPLGSADALRTAWPCVKDACVVTACDSLMDTAYVERFVMRFSQERPDALIGVISFEAEDRLPSSVVALDKNGLVRQVIEKPKTTQLLSDRMALPIYAFQSSFGGYLTDLEPSERLEYELPQAIQNLIDRGGVVRAEKADHRITINSPWEYLLAVRKMLSDLDSTQIEAGVHIADGVRIEHPVYVESGVQVQPGARLGPGAYVMSGSVIGQGAVVENAIIYENAVVDPGEVIRAKIVLPGEIIDPQKYRDSRGRAHRP